MVWHFIGYVLTVTRAIIDAKYHVSTSRMFLTNIFEKNARRTLSTAALPGSAESKRCQDNVEVPAPVPFGDQIPPKERRFASGSPIGASMSYHRSHTQWRKRQ